LPSRPILLVFFEIASIIPKMKKALFIIHCSLLIVLSGCGWTPMHSNSRALQVELSDIYIHPIAGTNGIDLRNYLILNWNTPNIPGAKYELRVQLDEPVTILKGLQRTGDATWEEVRLRAFWTLSKDGKVIAQATEAAAESYTFVSDLVSSTASRTNATQNAIQAIGDKIEMKVNARLKRL